MTRKPFRALLSAAESELGAAGIEAPRREARLIMAHALGLDPAGLLGLGAHEAVESETFEGLVRRRRRREPMAFLTGRQGFWTLSLAVSGDTLIPRADSESLIEAILDRRPDRGTIRTMLDLGTGTGCLLLACLAEYPEAFGVGVDLDPGACGLAWRNAIDNGLAWRTGLVCGDWADAISGRFDLVICNPPYIPTADLAGLQPEVRLHEPSLALDGGADGLDAYRALMPSLARLLAPGGLAVFEIGIGQETDVAKLGTAAGLLDRGVCRDLAGVIRAVLLDRGDPADPD